MNTALITGAGRGIGLATARAFLTAGWRVLALDLGFSGPGEKNSTRVKFDLQDLAAIPGLIASLGEIHALVNNAGVHNALPYDKYTEEARRRILRINLEAPAELMRAVAPGPVESEMLKVVDAARREMLLKQVYTGRVGRPEEIAAAILWLCTGSPATVNGAILDINDGTNPR